MADAIRVQFDYSKMKVNEMANSVKRASTTAKVTKRAIDEMIVFMVANHCGMILRFKGVEYAVTVRNYGEGLGYGLVVEREDGDYCRLPLTDCTVRKGWNTDSLMSGLSASYDRWIAGASAEASIPQYDQTSYRTWEQAYAHELWRMDTPDMLAYA